MPIQPLESGYVFTSTIGACLHFASRAQRVPAKVIADIVGHSDVRLTQNVYQHLYQEARREAAEKMAGSFPALTKSGHVEASTLKKQHARAITLSEAAPFVLYTLRHTRITRWAKHIDAYTLHVVAGHTDMNTTKRYVHPSDADVRAAMEKARGGENPGVVNSLPSNESAAR
jgi:integrase